MQHQACWLVGWGGLTVVTVVGDPHVACSPGGTDAVWGRKCMAGSCGSLHSTSGARHLLAGLVQHLCLAVLLIVVTGAWMQHVSWTYALVGGWACLLNLQALLVSDEAGRVLWEWLTSQMWAIYSIVLAAQKGFIPVLSRRHYMVCVGVHSSAGAFVGAQARFTL
jgi:hypothetical protein